MTELQAEQAAVVPRSEGWHRSRYFDVVIALAAFAVLAVLPMLTGSKALLDFGASAEGRAFMEHGRYGGLAAVDGSELRAFRPYALQVQERLRSPP